MLILAIDSSGKSGSVTVARCDVGGCHILETREVSGGTFSAQLIPTLTAMLHNHGIKKEDISAIACAVGPGSFTGLRIGLAAVMGLAEALNVPIATVSTLEAVAAQAQSANSNRILAALDAGRSEMFVGEYHASFDGLRKVKENFCTKTDLATMLQSGPDKPVLATFDQWIADFAASVGANAIVVDRPDSETIAQLGCARVLAGETVSVEELDANYLRPDHSLFSK